jgi:hypothetical protein
MYRDEGRKLREAHIISSPCVNVANKRVELLHGESFINLTLPADSLNGSSTCKAIAIVKVIPKEVEVSGVVEDLPRSTRSMT